jgi:hypothetical protein
MFFTSRGSICGACWLALIGVALADPVVPGTGYRAQQVGDDFEDPQWAYDHRDPKSSEEQDGRNRWPSGSSRNGRWTESALRGHPDTIRRVEAPAGGLPDSHGALLLATLYSGVPGRLSHEPQQDDFLASVSRQIGGYVAAAASPSVVTRVYLPPFDQWEQRSGVSFGFRLALSGRKGRSSALEPYWPGIFIRYYSRRSGAREDSAALVVRGALNGADVMGPKIQTPGWWTLGMSVSPDGQVHFYGRPGVEDLRAEDRLASYYCYGFRAERLQTFFFDVCNLDNGRSRSTSWIVDDTWLYATRQYGAPPAVVKNPAAPAPK